MGISSGVIVDNSPPPIKSSTLFGTKAISTTATLVNTGTIDLVGRTSITIQNVGLTAIYVSNVNTVTEATGISVVSGATISFDFDTAIAVPIYAFSIGVPTIVSVMEV